MDYRILTCKDKRIKLANAKEIFANEYATSSTIKALEAVVNRTRRELEVAVFWKQIFQNPEKFVEI